MILGREKTHKLIEGYIYQLTFFTALACSSLVKNHCSNFHRPLGSGIWIHLYLKFCLDPNPPHETAEETRERSRVPILKSHPPELEYLVTNKWDLTAKSYL